MNLKEETYYLPSIGRFLTRHSRENGNTLVPNPSNPQSFDRYSYVLNNPLKYSDPTGHNPVWCNDPYDAGGGADCTPLVDFDVTDGVEASWLFDEKMVIHHGVARIDFMLMKHGSSFLAVYGGTVTWRKTGTYSDEGNLGWRESQNLILVYEHNNASVISEGVRWVGHELGHSFDSALHPNTTDNRDYGQGTIDLATSDIRYTNERGLNVQIAGGCTTGNYLTSCYTRTNGEKAGYADEFNTQVSPMEDFADMFSGYTFGFADNAAAQARYDWMDSHMSVWIALAVANNNR